MNTYLKILSLCVILSFIGCETDDAYTTIAVETGEELLGGSTTVFNASEEAFGFSASQLTLEERSSFGIGNSFFRQSWVSSPASTTARDGLGPFYNAVACASCHFKDGRGRPPGFDGETARGLLLRLSLNGTAADGSALPDPIYGHQLQDNAILGQTTKGGFTITYQDIIETFDDGTTVVLKKPIYNISNLGYGALAAGIKVSPRLANQIIGLGLLEALDENTLLHLSDPNDTDGDGISGRPNYVYDVATNQTVMGRFGWKANQPNVRQQVAAAFSGDMGITSFLFPDENCPPGVDCNSIANGGSPEISDDNLNKVALYTSVLAVPVRRDFNNQNVLKGKETFETIGCTSCHIPVLTTGNTHSIAALRNQTIRPFTDLLLHDMGSALADDAPDFLATGTEWRTPALWGLGLLNTVNGFTFLMHDGRARNIEEAILWHGGEAQNAKNKYKSLSLQERKNLLQFMNTL
ncbi:di-heme oxidoredictase family protein [Flavobacterium sp. SM2513]|uniref:di-heme oxidoreductase family protein n=1 Tax=Flavobacterium sp. SM2513 TaxID=3424766 RepID=UPI003D7F951C